MNRKQRRYLSKNINKFDTATFKSRFYRTLLFTYNGKKEKIMEENGDLKKKINSLFMPRSLKELSTCNPTINKMMDFQHSVDLSLFLCEHYVLQLSQFVSNRDNYEKVLLKNEYSYANKELKKIDSICGVSIWSTGQKLLLSELELGIEGNKKLFETLLSFAKGNIIVSTLLEFLSYRVEINTSLNNYNEKVEKFLKHFDGIARTYFEYKLNLSNIKYENDYKYVLQIDSQFSIIDLYNSVIDILQKSVVNGYEIPDKLINRIISLNKIIHDYKLTNLLLFCGVKLPLDFNENILTIIEKYSSQNYEKTIELLKIYLEENPNDYQMWILNIKSHILYNKKFKNNNKILNAIHSVYTLQDNCIQDRNKLYTFMKMFSDTSWRYKLQSLTCRKLCYVDNSEKNILISLLNEHTITPRFISLLPNKELRDELLKNFLDYLPNTMQILTLSEKKIVKITSDFFQNKLFNAKKLFELGKYNESLNMLNEIDYKKYCTIPYIKEKIIRLKYSNYYMLDNLYEAIHLIVNAYFKNENVIRRCDLSLICKKLNGSKQRAVFSKVDYPIFVYLSDKLDIKKHRIAFSNFLDSHSIKQFEDLILLLTNDEKVLFFFEKIITLSVLKRENRFGKTPSLASIVRVKILQRLTEINPKSQKIYLEEISLITTKKEINNKIRQVSQRKIFVDEEKIKLEKIELFEENFQKYLYLKALNKDIGGFDVTDTMTITSIKNIVNNMQEDIKRSPQYSQTILALKELISDIVYEFLRNEHYGLDTYLSSRIRHGYCKSQLTKELRESRLMLLTTIDDEAMKFDVSQYWDEKIKEYQEIDYLKLKEILSEFTLNIEMKILEIRRKWIRIRLNYDEIGELDYTSMISSLLVIDKQNIVDFDFMYNTITTFLWEHTNKQLKKIRRKIDMELKPFYQKKLIELENKIKKLEDSSIKEIVHELINNINICRAKIATVMMDFANIFYKDDIVYEDYKLNELVTTCIGIEKQIHAEFENAKIEKKILGEKKLTGKSFSYLIEIIIMLLNNAVSHAGYSNMRDLSLSLFLCIDQNDESVKEVKKTLIEEGKNWTTDNLLIITVSNNLANDKDINLIKSKVADTFEHVKDPIMLKKYSISEGGSGLYKIYKTINYNMSVPYVILYNVEDNLFSLTLAVDATSLII